MKSPKLPSGSAASTSSSSLCRTLTQGSSLAFTGWIFYGSSRFSVLKCKNSSSHQMLLFKKFECKKLHVGSTSSFIFVLKIANSKTTFYKYTVLKSFVTSSTNNLFLLRWTLDASIIGSNPGEEFLRKKKSLFNKQKKRSGLSLVIFCLGVGLRPSSSDERIDSSMFQLEVSVSFVLAAAPMNIFFWKLWANNFFKKVTLLTLDWQHR